MSPLEITIAVGQRVTFVNNDVRAHDVVGGVDPAHPDCPEILQAGFLTPGQRGETGVFTHRAHVRVPRSHRARRAGVSGTHNHPVTLVLASARVDGPCASF